MLLMSADVRVCSDAGICRCDHMKAEFPPPVLFQYAQALDRIGVRLIEDLRCGELLKIYEFVALLLASFED